LTLGGCLGGVPTASELPEGPRHPDGVAVDPASAEPPARGQAEAKDGIVTLKTPLGTDRALATIDELFRRIVAEDKEKLPELFTRDAVSVSPSGGGTINAITWWTQRFNKLDYPKLAGEPVFRRSEAEVVRGEAALDAASTPAMRSEPLGDEDVVVRARVVTTHAGADRLFGDEIIFWLRRDGDRYKIRRMLEDFQFN
jgi:ketosteroid isomerase-like protein